MKTRILALGLAAALAVAGCSAVQPATAALPLAVDGRELPTLAPMLERATPAVVNIATTGRVRVRNPLLDDPFFRRFFDLPDRPRERRTQSLGSGVVVDATQGYVLTNHHVIDKAQTIKVTLRDGRTLDATLIGSDPETDVAVIQIPARDLTALPLADSDQLRVGDFVVAIGNPFGLGQTVTSGIVSALGRTGLGIEGYEDFIQTDASINPGNSGGALVNLRGELVGINTAILAPSGGNVGIGFAIPSNMASRLMRQIVEHGQVERGMLGVSAQNLTPELARAFDIPLSQGAVIAQVHPGSAAERAGLRPGDVVTAVNGRPVRDSAALRNTIGLLRVGETVTLEILREGRPQSIRATIAADAPTTVDGGAVNPRLEGAVFSDIPRSSPLYGEIGGALVADIEPGSTAARAGLRAGDLITSVNRRPIADAAQLREVAAGNRGLLLNIRRGRGALFLLLQ